MKVSSLKWHSRIFICFFFISLSGVGISHAAHLDLGSISGSPGSDVTIPITLIYEGLTPNISATSNDIGFNTGLLENPRASIGPSGSAAGKQVIRNSPSPGLFRVGIMGLNQNIIQEGIVAYVTFRIKGSASEGDATLTNIPSASDPNGNEVIVQGSAGTVHITLQKFTLTVIKKGSGTITSSPEGINCGANCTQDYNLGAQITLTATPITGSVFMGWSGACTGTEACSLTMDAAKTVTASFAQIWSGGGSISLKFTDTYKDDAGNEKFESENVTLTGILETYLGEEDLVANEEGCYIYFISDDEQTSFCITQKASISTDYVKITTSDTAYLKGIGTLSTTWNGEKWIGPFFLDLTKATLKKNKLGELISISVSGKFGGGFDGVAIFSGSLNATLIK